MINQQIKLIKLCLKISKYCWIKLIKLCCKNSKNMKILIIITNNFYLIDNTVFCI